MVWDHEVDLEKWPCTCKDRRW